MGSLRQDLAPFYNLQEYGGMPATIPQDLEDIDDDWGSDDECMILGTTPRVSLSEIRPVVLIMSYIMTNNVSLLLEDLQR